jgi:hypothetical protein
VVLHLGLVGRAVAGASVRLAPGEAVEPGGPVAYSFSADGVVHHGWRRGIEYGAQPLSVVYCPALPALHLTFTRPGLRSGRGLWSEPDYWLRLVLAATGMGLGWGLERASLRFDRRGGTFLPGRSRDEPR